MEAKSLEYTIPFQLTKTIRRDPYSAISPDNKQNSAVGKVVLITGGGTGIGAAAADVWTRAGAEGVTLAGRRIEKLEETASKIRALNQGRTKVLVVQTDLVKDKDVENLFSQTLKTFGRSPDVVLSNAGMVETVPIGEHSTDAWWNVLSTNLEGVYATAHHFIKTQPNPEQPVGTFIATNSGLAGLVAPGLSAYAISKLASQRLVEFLDTEYPTLRSFTLFPGIVKTPMLVGQFETYGHDHIDLTGMVSLYLSTSQADYLKGGLASVNWDVEEMEARKDQIAKENSLKLKWIPILPASGGHGLD
ncbi:short chain dehydrogenase-like protein [Penicillium cinerascens]|uniref:Short chain dehydrogenase-like protein n=1 Tax=Penicillium cinerascens TaxID=70096 RepID=A0A9W9JJT5_9EURO|nr:short chain dehydrogenase-like protein [Penicillium cinerascens]KAJ5198268.1 short chain dehydrogenase-like protein [Penicillium cinerascens]